jgi:hypothetical protein
LSRDEAGNIYDPKVGRQGNIDGAHSVATDKQKRLDERNKKAILAYVTNLKKLSKQEYREFHLTHFNSKLKDNSSEFFWRSEHEMICKQVYAPMSTNFFAMKYICIHLPFKVEYFHDALWVTEKLGLHQLLSIKQDYCPNLIQKFYATLDFVTQDNVGMTWMTNEVRRFSTFACFGQLLGYTFLGLEILNGQQMHVNTSEYNKENLAPLSAHGSSPEETSNLLALYNMLLRIFRANISPRGGKNDAIRGGLMNFLHFAYEAYEEGEICANKKIDVIHYIFSEMHSAMIEKKVPPYAPYIMKLILDKADDKDNIEEEILFEGMEQHQQSSSTRTTLWLATPSEDLGGNRYASGSIRENTDPPSGQMGRELNKLKWWRRAMFCMNNDVHQTKYRDYV